MDYQLSKTEKKQKEVNSYIVNQAYIRMIKTYKNTIMYLNCQK